MKQDLIALIDKPLLLALVLAIGAALGIAVERFVENQARANRRANWQVRRTGLKSANAKSHFGTAWRSSSPNPPHEKAAFDAAEQLRIVMKSNFKPRPLLNRPERRVLTHLDAALEAESDGWRAMGQVSLGEILSSAEKDAFLAINSKRVDFLVVDNDYCPRFAIEFQGAGHYQGTSAARDAVKKEALRRAGIGYVEIVNGDKPSELRSLVRKMVNRQ